MYYHASPVSGIKVLEPRVSNHNIPLVYFSKKRENTLVYISNAVERFCKESGFEYTGNWAKWGPYGFDKNGKLVIEEYYPDALKETYSGVEGYIYSAENVNTDDSLELNIPDATVSSICTYVNRCEFIPDAYEAIIQAEMDGLISIVRYDEFIAKRKNWIFKTIRSEYENSENHPEYRFFLKNKFKWVFRDDRVIDKEVTLIPYYVNYNVSLAWYRDYDVCKQVDNIDCLYTLDRLKAMYTFLDSHGECYYIQCDGVLCGDVTLRDNGEICIVICKEYQNRHIGRRAVADMLDLAREKGFEKIKANIYSFNVQSRKMFEAIGFVKTDEEWFEYII